ncbi:MAG TPA: MotA/TolQ/ExbB proton channel family protein [Beijerinckiaceae bacterium]|nr:MotA/TolQ/ExbB proton channel family protein [Beijerinckiaceae bacterium]
MTREAIEKQPALMLRRLRVRLYLSGFLVAFLLDLAVHGREFGKWFLLLAALLISVVGAELAGLSKRRFGAMAGVVFRGALIAAIAVTALVPLLTRAAAVGTSLPAAVAASVVWPQILVSLFGARVLAEDGALRLAEFWRRPLAAHGAVQLQSTPASFALAICFTLIFYLLVPHAGADASDPALSIVAAAIAGGTAVHCAIIFLFFVIIAHILEAGLLYCRDRALVNEMRAVLTDRWRDLTLDPSLAASLLESAAASCAQARGLRLMRDAVRGAGSPEGLDALSFEHFQNASRRFIRALLPVLPLLGFLGTIVGLSTTLADLPHALGGLRPGATLDFSGPLAGLAIKFQTTLLGLLASILAGLCLAVLERREAELAAECLLIGAGAMGDPTHG